MVFKVLLGLPFLKQQQVVFITHIPAEVAALTSLSRSYVIGQGSHCLRQLHLLLRKGLHSDDKKNHEDFRSKDIAKSEKNIRKIKLTMNNNGLALQGRTVKKIETVKSTSVFGGSAIC